MQRKTKKRSFIIPNSYFLLQNGMTLVELLVVTAIIAILSGTLLFNYRTAQDELTLNRSAHKIAQDIRRAKEMTMSARERLLPSGERIVVPNGYGVYFDGSYPSGYILFSDCNKNEKYTPGNSLCGSGPKYPEMIEQIVLEDGVKITGIAPGGSARHFIFIPPDPTVSIKGVALDFNDSTITISNGAGSKDISVNKVGLITIQ